MTEGTLRSTSAIEIGRFASRRNNRYKLALKDIIEGLKKWPIWLMLAKHDLYLSKRRSFLGPIWLTLSIAITIYSMGFLYSYLFKLELANYLPFLSTGMICWLLISHLLIEACGSFTTSAGYIREIKLPYTLYLHRVASRNILTFMHNSIALIPLYFLFPNTMPINLSVLFIIPGMILIYINAISYGLILAILSSRYRDTAQFISSIMRVIFFLTPVMWNPITLPEKFQFLIQFNPFYVFVQLVRAPLLGSLPSMFNLTLVFIVTAIGLIASISLFSHYRTRIIYWL